MTKKISKFVTNAMLLADFVVNIDRYMQIWTSMALMITQLSDLAKNGVDEAEAGEHIHATVTSAPKRKWEKVN